MIGYAIYKTYLYADKKMTDRYINSASEKHHFVAYLRNAKTEKIEKVDLVKN